jgi:hypothetical protein
MEGHTRKKSGGGCGCKRSRDDATVVAVRHSSIQALWLSFFSLLFGSTSKTHTCPMGFTFAHHSQNLPYDLKETNISITSQVGQNYFVHQIKPPPHAQNYTPLQ